MDWSELFTVFFFALLTALSTGLGALPLIFKKKAREFLAPGQVVAAALMTVASVQLIYEGWAYNLWLLLAGIVSGGLLIIAADKFIERFPDVADIIESNDNAGARKGLLIIFVMTVHSAAEGMGIGVSFGGGQELGILISVMIMIHNIPEGLAISLITVPRGMGIGKAALWSIGTSLPQPVIAVLAFTFVMLFKPFLPFGLGLAAGAMLWMVGSELLPEAREKISTKRTAAIFIITTIVFGTLAYSVQ